MKRRILKKEILTLLQEEDLITITTKITSIEPQHLLNPLFIALCSPIEIVRWHAVSCFGKTIPRLAKENLEAARIVMRRFLWMLNDESGGIGWGVPEAMAETMACDRRIFREYSHMLISYMRDDGEELYQDGNYLELPLLQRGLLWGVARLCRAYPEEMVEKEVAADLVGYLEATDREVVFAALYALSFLDFRLYEKEYESFAANRPRLRVYCDGVFKEIELANLPGR